jgi:type IV pilus assembly protein PilX
MRHHARAFRTLPARTPRGVILIVVLIALTMLLLAVSGLLRSSDSASLLAGNLGLKRDAVIHADQAIERALDQLRPTGALSLPGASDTSNTGLNYSAMLLPADENGVPMALRNGGAEFAAVANPSNNVTALGITLSYLVERMCTTPGPATPAACSMYGIGEDQDGVDGKEKPGKEPRPVYRVTVRATGPKDTATFAQMTFSPS